ncbi:MAG: RIP metalloprotease RseP [Alphaproteobacteria bacterium]|nr:RIP metalloprotease RseP [Alphaproteobacteria bacterium]MBV9064014.1 RIP metalloprotease RseP [Alphaproteobacteria bacterium]
MLGILHGILGWVPLGLPAFLFVITVVVFFHELGHFLVGRWCGVKVDTFSIGFGPAILKWRDRKDTVWKVSCIPLGGYVKFFGDADATSTPDRARVDAMAPAEQQHAFPCKPLYQRALVVLAGPVANFILAIAIFTGIFAVVGKAEVSTHAIPARIGTVTPHSPAAQAGLRPGDFVRAIGNVPVSRFEQLQKAIRGSGGKPLKFRVTRNREPLTIQVTPQWIVITDMYGSKGKLFGIGVSPLIDPSAVKTERLGPVQAVGAAAEQTWFIVDTTLTYMWRIVSGRSDTNQLSGPVGIARISQKAASQGFLNLIGLAALISVSIGLINLFPIPVLDGGHLLYYGCEAILGRPLGAQAQELGFRLGLAVVLGIFVLATWNDLVRPSLF